ncbi:MAG: hypothetical protein ACOVT5_04465, partial [Armatimonadaceae bacterium]
MVRPVVWGHPFPFRRAQALLFLLWRPHGFFDALKTNNGAQRNNDTSAGPTPEGQQDGAFIPRNQYAQNNAGDQTTA